ncbi:hypothetical protein O988_04744 [Pseudogymnoascus sp. VKM F-3808]|nr:hypothetical protein O988_04744 [Pseudogymnoascus sp. VKM F-3808]
MHKFAELLLTLPRWVRSGASHPRSGEDELEGKGAQANIGWLYGLTKGRDTKLESDWRGVGLGCTHELLVDQRVDLCSHVYAANLATARLSTAVRTNWLSSRGATMGVPVEVKGKSNRGSKTERARKEQAGQYSDIQ